MFAARNLLPAVDYVAPQRSLGTQLSDESFPVEGGSPMASLSDARVRQLLDGRYIASFATHNPNGSVHMVAVWFWFDGTDIYVATSSRSRKARNLEANPKVSLMIDARDPAASYGVAGVKSRSTQKSRPVTSLCRTNGPR
jgi:hypothetical protein